MTSDDAGRFGRNAAGEVGWCVMMTDWMTTPTTHNSGTHMYVPSSLDC